MPIRAGNSQKRAETRHRVVASSLVTLLLLGALILLPGCVTYETRAAREPVAETTLIVTRAGDKANIQWDSSPGMVYTILYAPERSAKARWLPLPGCTGIRGTGQTMKVEDTVQPGANRQYRLNVEQVAIPLRSP